MFEGVAHQFNFPVVVVPPTARTQEAVLRFLVAVLAGRGQLVNGSEDSVVKQMLQRERLGPTGFECGAAVPHRMTDAVTVPTGVVGQVMHGVVWGEKGA